MHISGVTGSNGRPVVLYEDDMVAFFRKSPWEVSDADIWRWRASVAALREMEGETY